jgi:IclR family acetate operon transcriptional repressor
MIARRKVETVDGVSSQSPEPILKMRSKVEGMQSVLRALRTLELLAERQPAGVSDLACALGLPKATTQRILVTLYQGGWIRQTRDVATRWSLSGHALTVALRGFSDVNIREAAREHIRALGRATNETVHLAVLDGLRCMVLVDRVDCSQPVRTSRPLGSASALHAGSTGLAALAHLPKTEIDEVIAQGLERFTPHTITDPAMLRTELAVIRERGYSINQAGNRLGVCAIGAAIFDSVGYPVGALCITMPDSRFDESKVTCWGTVVADTARIVSENVGV